MPCRTRFSVPVLLGLSLICQPALSTPVSPAPSVHATVNGPAAIAPPPAMPERIATVSAEEMQRLRNEVAAAQSTLQKDIAAVRPSWWERLLPAGMGLLGVLVGGWVSWRLQSRQLGLSEKLQRQQLRDNERLGRAKAAFESLSKVIDYRSKQVNEFYSPLRLMLRRSNGVRRQLTDQLRAKDPSRFVYVAEADGRDHLFVNMTSGTQVRFRLIEHMHELATKHVELMPLVREIVNIGESMTQLIDSKGGLALNESDRLNSLLGRYLAHFSILRDVTDKAEKSPALLEALQYNVAYPVELDGVLDADAKQLTDEIDEWKASSQKMWAEASNALPT